MRPGVLVAVIAVALLLAACTGSAPQRAAVPGGQAVATGPAQPPGTLVEITLRPSQPASPDALAAAAGVLRRRAALLGLQPVRVAVSGQDVTLTGPQAAQAQLAYLTARGVLAFRPVLLFAPHASTSAGSGPFGNPKLVTAATVRLFHDLACRPGTSSVDDSWKATVGYTPAKGQYDAPASQVVSCDARGSKYALAPAVFQGTDITSVTTTLQVQSAAQWVINLTLNGQAAKAFATLTTSQYNNYALPFAASGSTDMNDQVLAETAVVLDGDVQSAPMTQGAITGGRLEISGGGAAGFTEAAARNLAALIGGGQLPVILQIGGISTVAPASPGQAASGR